MDELLKAAKHLEQMSEQAGKMILRQLIERVNIEKDFEIEVEFKISVTQFFDFLHPKGDESVYYSAS